MQLGIHNWAEIISFLICVICILYKPAVLNSWFIFFLAITIAVELTGKATTDFLSFKMAMYNIFNGVEFIFYLSLLKNILENEKRKKLILLFITLFGSFFLINLFFIQGLSKYNNYTTTIGSLLLISACLIVFFELLSESLDKNVFYWPVFFVISGLLIFYLINFANYALLNYLFTNYPKLSISLYKAINNNSNVILYGFFSLAFVVETRRKFNKLSTKI